MIKIVWLWKSIYDKVLLTNKLTNQWSDNTISRVAFATENCNYSFKLQIQVSGVLRRSFLELSWSDLDSSLTILLCWIEILQFINTNFSRIYRYIQSYQVALTVFTEKLYTEFFFENVTLFWLCKTFKIDQISGFAHWNYSKSFESPIFLKIMKRMSKVVRKSLKLMLKMMIWFKS